MIVVRNVFHGTVGHAGGVAARRMLPAALLATPPLPPRTSLSMRSPGDCSASHS